MTSPKFKQLNPFELKASLTTLLNKINSVQDVPNCLADFEMLDSQADKTVLSKLLLKELVNAKAEKIPVICFLLEHYTPKEELVNKFWETLKNPNLNSEVKITIINLLRELDADWSYETCEEYLGEDSTEILDENTKKLLNTAIINPEVQIDFLDFLASIRVQDKITLLNSFEGDFSDGILLCQTPALIGSNLVAVNVALYIVPAVDGSVNLKVEVPYYAGVSYEKGKGVNGTMGLRSSMQTSIEAEGTMGLYFRTAPMLVTMRSIPLLDAELDIGAEAEATRTGRPNGQICSDVNVKCPVFIIGVGDESVKYKNKKSLFCTMDISKSYEFTSFARSKSLHYERLADGTKQFVEECTYNEQPEDDKPKESEASTEAPIQEQPTQEQSTHEQPTQEQVTQGTDVKESGPLHTYKTRMAEYFPEQTTFYFDYPDNWTVITERVGNDGEYIVLQNENGAKVCYDARPYIVDKSMYNFGQQYTSAAMSRIAKSRYNPGNDFWIVKIKNTSNFDALTGQTITYEDGAEMYAVTSAEKSVGDKFDYISAGYSMAFMFECPNSAGFRSEPSAKLTDKDREEIIAILQSFRDTP